MTLNEAKSILAHILCAYYGPGYTWRNAIEEICARYPRGEENTKGLPINEKRKIMAAFVIKQQMSRTRSYVAH